MADEPADLNGAAFRWACDRSNSRARVGGHSDAVDDQTAASFLLIRAHARILVEARPSPTLRPPHQACLDGVQVDILYLLAVFLHRAQGAVKKSGLPELPLCTSAPVDGADRTLLHRFDGQRDRGRVNRRADAMPVVGEKNPGRQVELMQRPRCVESSR